jgi:hypothetical protein
MLRIIGVCLLISVSSLGQTIWFVNAAATTSGNGGALNPFLTIQEGINAASSGDTVLVLPGIYNENISVIVPNLTIVSSSGRTMTTINGMSPNPTIDFPSGLQPWGTRRVAGFSIHGSSARSVLVGDDILWPSTSGAIEISDCRVSNTIGSCMVYGQVESMIITDSEFTPGNGDAVVHTPLTPSQYTMLRVNHSVMNGSIGVARGAFYLFVQSSTVTNGITQYWGAWDGTPNYSIINSTIFGGVHSEFNGDIHDCEIHGGIHSWSIDGCDLNVTDTQVFGDVGGIGNFTVSVCEISGNALGSFGYSTTFVDTVIGGSALFFSGSVTRCSVAGRIESYHGAMITDSSATSIALAGYGDTVDGCTVSGGVVGLSLLAPNSGWIVPVIVVSNTTVTNCDRGIELSGYGPIEIEGVTVTNCALSGIRSTGTTGTVTIASSRVEGCGGHGIEIEGGQASIGSCLVAGNSGDGVSLGAGVTNATLAHLTIANNNGAGLAIAGGTAVVVNSILNGNGSTVSTNGGSVQLVRCCSDGLPPLGPSISAEQGLLLSPMFVDALNGNYELHPTSACINTAIAAHPSVTYLPTMDIAGNSRSFGPAADLGAYEATSPTSGAQIYGANPATLAQPWTLHLASPAAGAPAFVFIDLETGNTPLAPGLTSQLGHTPALLALVAPFWSPWSPAFGQALTNANGEWSMTIPIPASASALPLNIWMEAFVVDLQAPNGLAWRSNLLPVSFGLGSSPPTGFSVQMSTTPFSAWNRTSGVADLNGDNIPDLASTSAIWAGNGAGGFLPSPLANDPPGIEIGTADFNNDGIQDLVTSDAPTNPFASPPPAAAIPDETHIYLGNGQGQFLTSPITIPRGTWDEGAVTWGDLNGDGWLDVVVASGYRATGPGVQVFLSSGGQTPTFTSAGPGFFVGSRAVAVGDFNGDTFLDIAADSRPATGFGATLRVLWGDNSGAFSLATSSLVTAQPGFGAGFLASRDFNADGIPELIWAISNRYGVLKYVNSVWSYSDAGLLSTATIPSQREPMVSAIDLNHDGHLDLVTPIAGIGFAYLGVALNDGAGSFPYRFQIPLPSATSPMFAIPADMNQDGVEDLLIGGQALTILINQN